ncbi:cytochrome-c peroxidase [Pedobacter sp. MC2016-24]|uniref:cytochrome-c peroxidase n=1 Tax=Pedobacter sp. MC2016-24 TaxID=2780090 RepID=UPI00187E3F9D|nr:cytochrome c peroxidase [Pedobacter sp. MC2016-24]MBE9599259.1 cytochrome-c peroxidase [Pedobacter sp. MC2016-24]
MAGQQKGKIIILVMLAVSFGILAFGFLFSSSDSKMAPNQPLNFPKLPADTNIATLKGISLGRTLFQDPGLSADRSVSCASCHKNENAYSDPGIIFSKGSDTVHAARNTPALMNLQWKKSYFADARAHLLSQTVANAIQSPVEMASSIPVVLARLNKSDSYKKQFQKVFGTEEITEERLMKVFKDYLETLVTSNSRYDAYSRQESLNYTLEEHRGLTLFRQKCSPCHAGELFTDESLRNAGTGTTADQGRGTLTKKAEDMGKFKVPSLRNIGLSSPYMHDGRFTTLAQVLEHYSNGINQTKGLDSALYTNGKAGIPLNSTEKKQLLAFLNTLTDPIFIRQGNY